MDIVPTILDLLLVVFLIFMNGFFVAAEFCCVKMRSSRLETMIAEGSSRAKYAKQLTDHLDSSLSVTQLGITLASLGLGWVGEPAVAQLILPLTRSVGLSDDVGHTVALAIAFSLITSLHIVLGELTPKSMAIANVERIMLAIAFPMVLFGKVMKPFVWILNTVANHISRHLGYEMTGENEDAHTEEEIRLLMKESYRQGLINSTEADFVDNVFSFTELNAREIMVPRTDMICLYLDDTPAERIKTILEEQQTRYPVCYEDKDHIIGFIHVKDLLPPLVRGETLNLRRYIRKALIVPESMDGSVLLRTMQAQGSQLAIVVDEYGGTAGMVTVEDIVEQIVGDIRDEFDEERESLEWRGEDLGSIDAKLLLEEVNDLLGIRIEDEDVDSIGGWIYDRLGEAPRVGHMTAHTGTLFFVEEVDGVRITRVLVRLPHTEAEQGGTSADNKEE
ncbi:MULTISPECIES: hemolysin family protein [Selenomonas]|uniref:hemolysin family protein n=1 Tax=Selenomonas TaxID=970 RepID=UPI00027A44AA|nr:MULTISPECIES: hemolysin family protein [Selenomonas]EJP33141.1 membrane protein, PF01595 family [Selenomonas sp. FOBRC9]MBF1681831.1 HlyC/CorC family transporter [Selenomonas artemidis]